VKKKLLHQTKQEVCPHASLDKYLDFLSRKHRKLGHAICPYLKKYRANTYNLYVDKTSELTARLQTVCSMLGPLHIEAVVLYGFRMSYEKLEQITNTANKRYGSLGVTVLRMHPDTDDFPLPVKYNYKQPLLIVQRTSTLERARAQLKQSKYYDNWSE